MRGSTVRGKARNAAKAVIETLAAPWGTARAVRTRERTVALTFDDGPDPRWTPRFAELLERHQARGTFFMVGRAVEQHPSVVERVVAGGHALANHGWDHRSMPLLESSERRREICRAAQALAVFQESPPGGDRWFRPPYGHHSPGSHWDAHRCGHRVVAWSAIAEDWRDDPAAKLVERVRRRLEPGAVVLFHDSLYTTDEARFRDRSPSLEAVERLLTEAGGDWRFVTLPELFRLGPARKWPWYPRPDLEMLRRQERPDEL